MPGPQVELLAHTSNPIELCGTAGGICYDKPKKRDYPAFIEKIVSMGHESIVEHASFTFLITGISRSCTHQLVRHRIASYSQRSQRHVDESNATYIEPPNYDKGVEVFREAMATAWKHYRQLLNEYGWKKEDARLVLPNACSTTIVVTMNGRELRHFFKLRLAKDAQWEIRIMAQKMFDLAYKTAPAIFKDLITLRSAQKESSH